MIDGTGFGFNTPFYQRVQRGEGIRRIKSHVKVVALLIETEDGVRVLGGIKADKAYSDERHLWEIKSSAFIDLTILLGDSLYGMDVRGLSECLERGIKVISPIKNGIHNRVKHPVRLEVKRFYEERGKFITRGIRLRGPLGI